MLEARNFRIRKKSDCTGVGYHLVGRENIKADLSCALICAFDITYAKCKFSHDAAQTYELNKNYICYRPSKEDVTLMKKIYFNFHTFFFLKMSPYELEKLNIQCHELVILKRPLNILVQNCLSINSFCLYYYYYRKVPKFLNTRKLCSYLPKIQTKRQNLRVFCQNVANGIANSADPDH